MRLGISKRDQKCIFLESLQFELAHFDLGTLYLPFLVGIYFHRRQVQN